VLNIDTSVLQDSSDSGDDLREIITQTREVPSSDHYRGHNFAKWKKIAENYDCSKNSKDLLKRILSSKETVNTLESALRHGVTIVDLGAGTPAKDSIIIEAMSELCCSKIKFIPFDCSNESLVECYKKIHEEYDEIEIVPMLGDFKDIIKHLNSINTVEPKVVFLLGSTIGNIKGEKDYLEKIRYAMGMEDLLVIDFEYLQEEWKMVEEYSQTGILDFVSGPIERFFDKIDSKCVEVRVIDSNMVFLKKGNDYYQIQLTDFLRSKTVVFIFSDFSNKLVPWGDEILLIHSTKYERKEVKVFLNELFEIVDKKETKKQGIFLLKKRPAQL